MSPLTTAALALTTTVLLATPAAAQQADTPTATLASPNRAPVVTDDSAVSRNGAPVVVRVFANDADPDGDVLQLVGGTSAGHGRVSFDGDTATYVPDAGFSGEDSFVYVAGDAQGATASGTVRISVTSSAPVGAAVAPEAAAPKRWPSRGPAPAAPVAAAAPRVVVPAAKAPAPVRQPEVRTPAVADAARTGPSTTPYVAPSSGARPAALPFTGPREAALPLGLALLVAGVLVTVAGRRRSA